MEVHTSLRYSCFLRFLKIDQYWGSMRLFVAGIFIFCLFSFKVEIIGDVRIDDLLVVILSVIAFWFFIVREKGRVQDFSTAPILWFLLFFILNIFSSIYNAVIGRVDLIQGLLFSFRHFEYFLFVFLGYMLSYYRFNFSFWLKLYIVFALVIIPLQSYGLVPVVSGFSPDRAIANTGGPWEMAAVAAFLLFYFLEYRYFYLVFFSFVILISTESRVTLAAVLLSSWLNLSRSLSWRVLTAIFLTGSLAIIIGVVAYWALPSDFLPTLSSERNVINRVITFFSYETFASVVDTVNSASVVMTSEEFSMKTISEKLGVPLESFGGDPSAIVRFTNWAILLKSLFLSADSLLFGLGPSFAGKAVDGGFVRLLVETGFLGLTLYIAFIASLLFSARSRLVFNYFLVLVVSALLIDMFTTYKAMFLLWVFYGRDLSWKGARVVGASRPPSG